MAASTTPRPLFAFPNPVNELAARVVAGGVVVLAVAFLVSGWGVLLVPLAYGFWARVLTGPRLSLRGQLATRVVAPRLSPAKLVPGPPKRFAQGVGVAFSTTALVLWFGAGAHLAASLVVGALTVAAVLESVFALCLGCRAFSLLMAAGVIPESVCEDCADVTRRHPALAER